MATETQITSDNNFYHFKTLADFEAHKNEIKNNSTIYVDENFIGGSGMLSLDLLWTNPNPTSSFENQTIILDLSEYEFICFSYKWVNNTSTIYAPQNIFPINGEDYTTPLYYYTGSQVSGCYFRQLKADFNGITFNYNNNSSYYIPYQIFGMKKSSGGNSSGESNYPVGSLYMSVNETSPAELFGGTWEQISSNATILTSSSAPVGITDVGIPNGYHLPNGRSIGDGFVVYYGNYMATGFYDKNTKQYTGTYSGADTSFSLFADLSESSLSGIYIWKRIY